MDDLSQLCVCKIDRVRKAWSVQCANCLEYRPDVLTGPRVVELLKEGREFRREVEERFAKVARTPEKMSREQALEAALRLAETALMDLIETTRSRFTKGPRTKGWDAALAEVREALKP